MVVIIMIDVIDNNQKEISLVEKEDLEMKEYSFTDLDNYFSQIDLNYVRKAGNICLIEFRALTAKRIPNNTNFINCNQIKLNKSQSTLFSYVDSTQYGRTNNIFCFIDVNGNIKGAAIAENSWVNILGVVFTTV